MTRFIMPIVLIGIAIAAFLLFANPMYNDISQLRTQATSYNEALGNSKALENERDKLTAKYNSIDPNNLLKLQKLLPDNIDNIRLILEIGQIAMPYNMVLKNVKYNATPAGTTTAAAGTPGVVQGGGAVASSSNSDYGTWDLEFSTTGTYNNFINFTKDLESNLRIVDISSIDFSSSTSVSSNPNMPESYTYDFKIRTYWLKN